jgi:hypothetical protein
VQISTLYTSTLLLDRVSQKERTSYLQSKEEK